MLRTDRTNLLSEYHIAPFILLILWIVPEDLVAANTLDTHMCTRKQTCQICWIH